MVPLQRIKSLLEGCKQKGLGYTVNWETNHWVGPQKKTAKATWQNWASKGAAAPVTAESNFRDMLQKHTASRKSPSEIIKLL